MIGAVNAYKSYPISRVPYLSSTFINGLRMPETMRYFCLKFGDKSENN